MAKNEIGTLTEESWKRLKDQFQHLETLVRNLRKQLGGEKLSTHVPELYTGKTTTNAANPTYPSSSDNTFVVKLTDIYFTEAVGDNDPEVKESGQYVIARTQDGSFIDEDTSVLLERRQTRRGIRWWIVANPAGSVVIKSGKTVSEDYAYPDGNADTFEVRLDKWSFVETPGEQGSTPEISTAVVIAQTFNGQFIHEGADVIVIYLVGPSTSQWWIIEAQHEYKGVTYEDIEPDDHGEVTLWINGAETTIKLDAWLDWMHGDEAIEENTQVIVRWFQDQGKWIIVQSACEPISDSTG